MLGTHQPLDEPAASLAGPGLAAAARRAFLATRPAFFVASVMPVLVGTVWADLVMHRFDGLLLSLALGATALAHAATNIYNDVSDDLIGADAGNVDRMYPFTGGSRFIQSGLLSRGDMMRLALGLTAAALALGLWLALLRGPGVVLFGIAGVLIGLLYSLPGVQLSARGIGELAVAVGLGALPLLGAVWLQSCPVGVGAILISIPVSAWVAAILMINEVPDIAADRRAGKRTLAVRWGADGARRVYAGLTMIALSGSLAAVVRHALPAWYALAAVAVALVGLFAARGVTGERGGRSALRRSIKLTLAIHALGCLSLIVAIASVAAAR